MDGPKTPTRSIWQDSLSQIEEQGIYPAWRTVTQNLTSPTPVIDGRQYLSFASNNYLGLSEDKRVKAAAVWAIRRYGVGPGFSRVIGGTPEIVDGLERALADWTGFAACLTFPTGYMTNIGVIPAVLRTVLGTNSSAEVGVMVDQFIHGSVIDGCRLAGAKIIPFRHDDLDDLRRKLKRYAGIAKLIITEGVFTLEGTIIDVSAYVEIAKETGTLLMVDDAHGIGLLGPTGGGVCQSDADLGEVLYMSTLDKSLGATGGFVCGSQNLIRLLRVACRSSILSSCLPAVTAGAVLESLVIAQKMSCTRDAICDRAESLRQRFRAAGLSVFGAPSHPSVSLLAGNDLAGIEIERQLYDRGLLQPVVRWPAVPKNQSRFRINLTALHTDQQIDHLASALMGLLASP